MSRTGARDALLDAAASLMDEHGVDFVSLNEINRIAGQHNRSAVQYHFGTRENLVVELAERTMTRLDAERSALLDHLEAVRGQLSPRDAIEVVVGPLIRLLSNVEGRRYLRLTGQLLNHPRYNEDARNTLQLNDSIGRCARYIHPLVEELPPPIRAERISQGVMFAIRAIADQSRLMDVDPPPRPVLDTPAFATNLADVIMGMLTAPITGQSAEDNGGLGAT